VFTRLLILILLISLIQPQSVGVKPGDWAIYERRHQVKRVGNWRTYRNATEYDLETIDFQFISIEGSSITYAQALIRNNGSLIERRTFTVNINEPIFTKYTESMIRNDEIQHILSPSDLAAGDRLPQVVRLTNEAGDGELLPWYQVVDSTTTSGDPLYPRAVNHVEWSYDVSFIREGEIINEHTDKVVDFDQATGLTLRSVIRQDGSYEDGFGLFDEYSSVTVYRLIDSSAIPHNYFFAGITVASLIVGVILALHPWKRGLH
jgi:hypothetical protein